ncbi:hypothetical protein EV122DRAFT_200816 [Schizophyllum commune]
MSRRSRSRSYSRSRSRSPERRITLPYNAQPISDRDYFLKSDEFRLWLKDEKRKYFDELSGDKARSYFRKFVKAWNRGKLSREIYAGVDPSATSASSQTSYKWSFASKGSRTDHEALRSVREEIAAATYAKHGSSSEPSTSTRGKQVGPTLPSSTDLQLARETEEDTRETERRYKRKRDKLEARDRIEDMVGPKEVGREGMLEKKRARREEDRAYRERGDEGLEADESTLMGGGDDFQSVLAKRKAATERYSRAREMRDQELREKAGQMKEKEKATMDMFKQMAAKFG